MAGQVNNPGGLWVDNKGGLWMADISNNRVLYWAQSHLITTNGQSANRVPLVFFFLIGNWPSRFQLRTTQQG